MTKWKEGGGGATLADGGWQEWLTNQTERVFDLMDCSLLRIAKTGVDVEFKSGIWNLSQNVDRQTDSKQLAICPVRNLIDGMIHSLTSSVVSHSFDDSIPRKLFSFFSCDFD